VYLREKGVSLGEGLQSLSLLVYIPLEELMSLWGSSQVIEVEVWLSLTQMRFMDMSNNSEICLCNAQYQLNLSNWGVFAGQWIHWLHY